MKKKASFYRDYFARSSKHTSSVEHGAANVKDKAICEYLRRHKSKVKRLLDVGCLNSCLFSLLKDFISVEEYYGVDLIPFDEAEEMVPGIYYIQADVDEGIPLGGMEFDVIVCSEILEHLFDPDIVFQFAKSNLARDGLLILTTPNLAAWYNRLVLFLGFQPCHTEVSTKFNVGKIWTNDKNSVGGHLRLFTFPALRELGEEYGLMCRYCTSIAGGKGIINGITRLLTKFGYLGHTLFCVLGVREITDSSGSGATDE